MKKLLFTLIITISALSAKSQTVNGISLDKIDATYIGRLGNHAEFYLIVSTSDQVPSSLIEQILPGEIKAHPA